MAIQIERGSQGQRRYQEQQRNEADVLQKETDVDINVKNDNGLQNICEKLRGNAEEKCKSRLKGQNKANMSKIATGGSGCTKKSAEMLEKKLTSI